MDSETQIGPLTLLRAGDWVAHHKRKRERFFLDSKGMSLLVVKRITPSSETKTWISQERFSSGEWIVVEPNPDINATILGVYNKPVKK